jgi:imidazolonepropionase-like amidohydrolase
MLPTPIRRAPKWPCSLVLAALSLLVFGGLAAHADAPGVHAIVGARIVTAPGQVIEKGTIVMRDGLIAAVGAKVAVPADARVWDGTGLTVYPGLIDPHVTAEAAPAARGAAAPSRGAAHELSTVRPETRAVTSLPLSENQLEALRAAGFAAAQVAPSRGILRGTSAVIGLGRGSANASVLRSDAAQVIALQPDTAGYPGSLMGVVAVIRQALSDARWYAQVEGQYAKSSGKPRPDANVSWEALGPLVAGQQNALFVANDMLDVLRAATIAREAGIKAQVLGSGDEYKRARDIAAAGVPLVVPVNFPEPPDVADPDQALEVTTEELRHWDQAPGNAAALRKAGVRFAFTGSGLKDVKTFRSRVGKAIDRGLGADDALAAVTTVPAELLGLSSRLGTIAPGKVANLTVTRGDLFSRRGRVRQVWVDGARYEVQGDGRFTGDWLIRWDGHEHALRVDAGKDTTVKLAVGHDTLRAERVRLESRSLSFVVRRGQEPEEYFHLTPQDEGLEGSLTVGDYSHTVAGRRAPAPEREEARAAAGAGPIETPVVMGNTEPWRMPPPAQPAAVLVRNATIWTAGAKGTLESADLLVRGGKIAAVGKSLQAPANAVVIDAQGKHVAPGIIDAHSHSAVVGQVNECTHNITAEVRIRDVINSESINIYRQLAGGATIMHVLHGSCNAIGGQCAVIKNKWGESPEHLLFTAAPQTIKFALGENPKKSNFDGRPASHFPQSRAGVEQLIRDSFTQARDYRAAMQESKAGKQPYPPRRDLQKEAVVEILEGKRLIHAHSYRQDEILMLMRVAEEFGIKVQTFQHILEGYKVADEMARHGASGSSFSDWWGYKFEVIDAIPQNGYLMWDRGVTVSYNSDSDELARRLNTEAAKAVKYGGVPREEAIKFVTLNPAKQLRVDDRVGSLEVGKDADFAIWSGSPLSPYSLCEQTWIEGRKYFDRAQDLEGRAALVREREALIEKARGTRSDRTGPVAGNWPPRYLEDADRTGNSCGGELEHDTADHADEKEEQR